MYATPTFITEVLLSCYLRTTIVSLTRLTDNQKLINLQTQRVQLHVVSSHH